MTPFFRSTIDREELGSTSDLAREMVASPDTPLPLLVRARRQTSGRGRGANRWFSDEGSLTFTLAVDPADHGLRRDHEPLVALATAVGIIDAVEALVPDHRIEIRWPNDIEVGRRKLAGLLTERVESPRGPRLLLGIGLNVTTRFDRASEDVKALATSLERLGATGLAGDDVLRSVLDRFPTTLARLAADDPSLADAWIGRDALLGAPVRLRQGDETIEGLGAGITREGALRIDRGDRVTVHHGGQVLRESRP